MASEVGVTPSDNVEGKIEPLKQRIVGGRRAVEGEFPYQVGLALNSGTLPFCGGSVIAKRWIVTAAHCLKGSSGLQFSISSLRPFVGTVNARSRLRKELSVAKVIIHGSYSTSTHSNDIALIKTTSDIPVQPISLPSQGAGASGSGVVSGWGTIREGGPRSTDLLTTELDILPDNTCQRIYRPYSRREMLCGGYLRGGRDTCQGDSGGPFAQSGVLIGITSFGRGCARANTPGVYTRVSNYVDWIRYYVNNH